MSQPEHRCSDCGMTLSRANEYHPFAACLMYRQCRDSTTVQENLLAVIKYGQELWNTKINPLKKAQQNETSM